MNTYTITYRKSNGTVDTVTLEAYTFESARAVFFARYDGRIITING